VLEQNRLYLTGFKLRYAWRRWFLFRRFLPTRDKHHLTRFRPWRPRDPQASGSPPDSVSGTARRPW